MSAHKRRGLPDHFFKILQRISNSFTVPPRTITPPTPSSKSLFRFELDSSKLGYRRCESRLNPLARTINNSATCLLRSD